MKKEAEEGFGKDLGLIHQVVCAGREIGADHDFWSFLAYDRKVFRQAVELVKKERARWLTLSVAEIDLVQNWLNKIEREDCPFPEEETYYTRSSHSMYEDYFSTLHSGGFEEIFRKGSQSKRIARLCRMIEASFVVSYLLSGYYSAEQDPEGKNKRWMHGPFGITTYFHDIWNGDTRVRIGDFFNQKDLQMLCGLSSLNKMVQESTGYGRACVSDIVKSLQVLKTSVIKDTGLELHPFLKEHATARGV